MPPLNSIAILRVRQGMTQVSLARAASIPCKLLKEYEAGTRSPRLDHAIGIAATLGTDIKTLAETIFPARQPLPAYVPPVFADEIDAEIHRLRSDLAYVENKDRQTMADMDEERDIRNRLFDAHQRRIARDERAKREQAA